MSAGPARERMRFSGLENPSKRKAGERAGAVTIRKNAQEKQGRSPCRDF